MNDTEGICLEKLTEPSKWLAALWARKRKETDTAGRTTGTVDKTT
jgi:hypothetical protein